MGTKKWFPVNGERIVTTAKYRYVIGFYNHDKYGNDCFRVSKFLVGNNYFIGHFVIVDDDFEEVSNAIIAVMTEGVYL